MITKPKVTLITHTPNPEKVVAAAAKLCYSAVGADNLMEGLTPEKTEKFLNVLMELGHQSPVEHVTFTFGIEGVSRSFLAQVTRHRIASYSVQSQRYVKLNPFDYIVPPQIAEDKEALKIYEESMQQTKSAYEKISDILIAKNTAHYLAEGLSEKAAASKAEKQSIEDARFVLPNSCETKMVMTMDVRSLYNFFNIRCCNRAQWEIRAVATEMCKLVKKEAPILFKYAGPSCVHGVCPEANMSCGKSKEMKELFINM